LSNSFAEQVLFHCDQHFYANFNGQPIPLFLPDGCDNPKAFASPTKAKAVWSLLSPMLNTFYAKAEARDRGPTLLSGSPDGASPEEMCDWHRAGWRTESGTFVSMFTESTRRGLSVFPVNPDFVNALRESLKAALDRKTGLDRKTLDR
jgi:hypothetical protein